MKNYRNHFKDLIKDYYYRKLYERLKPESLLYLDNAIDYLSDFEPNERELKINRLFIDKKDKPKQHLIILDLLASTNSRDFRDKYPESLKRKFKFAYEKKD